MRRIAIGSPLVSALFVLLVMAPSCGGNTITPPAATGTGGSSTGNGGSYNPGTGGQGGDAGIGSTGGAAGQGGMGGSMSTGGAAGQAGGNSASACVVSDDCTWGEIATEITRPSDCMCLYGCPYLPQNKTTQMRRYQQYRMFCTPNVDGNGHPCGVDDCIPPPQAACIGGMCTRVPVDAGAL